MEKVIVEYVYPLLSVLRDESGARYLCICYDTRGAQQWVVTPITIIDLINLLSNRLELITPFLQTPDKTIFIKMDYFSRKETHYFIDTIDFPLERLPEKGEFLDSEPGEWDAYIRELSIECEQNFIDSLCSLESPYKEVDNLSSMLSTIAETLTSLIIESSSTIVESLSYSMNSISNHLDCKIKLDLDYISDSSSSYDESNNIAA